jgi:hypothetical protein
MLKKVSPQLPKGFKAITGGGDSWKPEKKGASIQGVLSAVKSVHFDKKGKMAARDVNVYTIRTKDGDLSVWDSAGLRALANVKKGREVFVQYLGLKQIGKGRNPMRDYLVAVR